MQKGNAMSCNICQRDTCGCLHRIHRQLRDITENYTTAEKNLIPGNGGDGRGTERSLGVRLIALDFISGNDVLPQLEEWEKDWRSFFELTPFGMASLQRTIEAARSHAESPNATDPYPQTYRRLTGCVDFISTWVHRAIQEHPAIDEFALELRQMWNISEQAAGKQPINSWMITCPADTHTGDCGNRLRITGQDFDGHITCRNCQTQWAVERLLRVAAADKQSEIWLAPDDAARLFGIPERTLRAWAQKGYIRRAHGQYEHHSIRAAVSEGATA